MIPKGHSVHPLRFCREAEPPTKFSKRGERLDRTSTFRGGLLGKRGITFCKGVLDSLLIYKGRGGGIIEEKLIFCFKNDNNLVNFDLSTKKSKRNAL